MESLLLASTNVSNGSPVGAIGGGLVGYVLVSLALMGIFTKAGEQGWKGFVPIYNYYVLLKLVRAGG